MLKQTKQNPVQRGMIISCSSCQTKFRVDESRIGPDGKKVRCSKCGHVWRAVAETQPALSVEQPVPVLPPAGEPVFDAPRVEPAAEKVEQPVDRVEPLLTARLPDEAGSQEDDEPGPDSLSVEQSENLAAARQQKPRNQSWVKVLTIFIVVAGLLLLAQRMLPPQSVETIGTAGEQPTDVGKVEAKRVSADPAKGGHIVGSEPPAQ